MSTAAPTVSFIVPAYDEEALIARTLGSIRRAMADGSTAYEMVVVDDASTDATASVARAAGAEVVSVSHRQIAATRNAGARRARGEMLIFVDADTQVGSEAVAAAIAAMRGGAAGGGAEVHFDGRLPRYARLIQPLMNRALRTAGLTGGCFLFCTRDAFRRTGGFDEALYSSEEISMCRALGRCGPFVVLRERVVTSGRKLRIYTGWELLGILGRLGALRSGTRSRAGHEAWYGPRRDDPDPPPE